MSSLVELQIAASIFTLAGIWQTGSMRLTGPVLALVGDAAFLALNIHLGLWWLMPLCFTVMVLHVRTFWLWRHQAWL